MVKNVIPITLRTRPPKPPYSFDSLVQLANYLEDLFTVEIGGHRVNIAEYEERPDLAPPGSRLAVRRPAYRALPGLMAILIYTEGEHKGKGLAIPSLNWDSVAVDYAVPPDLNKLIRW